MKTITGVSVICLLMLVLSCSGRRGPTADSPIPVVELPKPGIPAVIMQILVKSGSSDDPEGKEGLAQFTANLMLLSKTESAPDGANARLESLGASLNVEVDRETILFSCWMLRENLDQAYEALSSVILHPEFQRSEAEQAKLQMGNQLNDILQDDYRLCLAVFQNWLYEGHRYAHPTAGIRTAIKPFTAEDADSFYKYNFRSNNMIIGVAGDYPEDFPDKARSDFEGLPLGEVENKRGNVRLMRGRNIILLEKATGTMHFRMGNIILCSPSDPDYYAFLVAQTYPPRQLRSYLQTFEQISSAKHLNHRPGSYGQHCGKVDLPQSPPMLSMWSPMYHSMCGLSSLESSVQAIKSTILGYSMLSERGIDVHDLDKSKRLMIADRLLTLESPEERLKFEIEKIYHGDSTGIAGYVERVAEVTPSDISDALRRHWSADDWLLVAVVPDGELFKAALLSRDTIAPDSVDTAEPIDSFVREDVERLDLKLTEDEITIVKASELLR